MIAVPPGMTLPAYLDQTKVWIDGRSGTVFPITELSEQRRGYAARELLRSATGIISLMETWALMTEGLVPALQLVAETPREWMLERKLYKALATGSEPRTGAMTTATDSDVVTLPRSAAHQARRIPRDLAS